VTQQGQEDRKLSVALCWKTAMEMCWQQLRSRFTVDSGNFDLHWGSWVAETH